MRIPYNDDTNNKRYEMSQSRPLLGKSAADDSVAEQLAELGRVIDPVPPNGNCMFESLARQSGDSVYTTAAMIREAVCDVGREMSEHFVDFYAGGNELYFQDLERLRNNGVWNVEIGDLAIGMAQVALGVQIMVIRSNNPPLLFPHNSEPPNDKTVVIVQNNFRTHYDATKEVDDVPTSYQPTIEEQLKIYGRLPERIPASNQPTIEEQLITYSRLFEKVPESNQPTIEEQLDACRRVIERIPANGNSLFESVARQLARANHRCDTHQQLRHLVCTKGINICYYYYDKSLNKNYLEYFYQLRLHRRDGVWNPKFANVVMKLISRILKIKIVVLSRDKPPQQFPADESSENMFVVIVVRDVTGEHYNATVPANKKRKYEDAVDQLKDMGRFIDVVPPDGNCMFESIARQIKGNTLVTAQTLRESVYNVGKEKSERFIDFYEGDKDLYFEDLERLRQDGTWDVAIGDLALSIAQVALDVPIVVVKSFNRPLMFPDDDSSITEDTVVIVQNRLQTHYDATRVLSEGWENGLAVSQMRALHRNAILMVKNGNSFFEAVADQLDDDRMSANTLRQMVCTSLETYPDEFVPSQTPPAKLKKFRAAVKHLRADSSWGSQMKIPVMMAMADGLNRQIVILADYTQPIVYPANNNKISEDMIVLIQSRSALHFDSTTPRAQGEGSAVYQMENLNRRIVPMLEDGNSFFNAICDQLKNDLIPENLRQMACTSLESDPETFAPMYGSSVTKKEFLSIVKSFRNDLSWGSAMKRPATKVLADGLNKQIVVLIDNLSPIIYPANDDQIRKDAIVLIQDSLLQHFDSTEIADSAQKT